MNVKRVAFRLSIIAVLLLVAVAAGAGGTQGGAAAAAPMKITWMCQYTDAWYFSMLEEKFNVDIESNGIYVNTKDKVDVMLAAGEFPDCGPLGYDPKRMYNEGVTRPIPKDWIRQYAPKYSQYLSQYSIGWLMNVNPDNENELLCLNGINVGTDSNIYYPMVRCDWMKSVGFDLEQNRDKMRPLDGEGVAYYFDLDITLDWLTDVLEAFKKGDPDGNGVADTIPWGACNQIERSFPTIFGAFGVPSQYNRIIGGELIDWRIDPSTQDVLKALRAWYQDGLIDSEFVSIDVRKAWEKIAARKVAVHHNIHVTSSGNPYDATRPPWSMVSREEIAKGAYVAVLPPPIGPGGARGGPNYRSVGPLSYYWYFNKKVDDAKLKKLLEIFDYCTGDTEQYIQRVFGKPGVHFDWEGEPWNSKPMVRSADQVPAGYPKQGGIDVYLPLVTDDRVKFYFNANFATFLKDVLLGPRGKSFSYYPARWDELGTTNLSDINKKHGTDLKTIWEEFFYKAVAGTIDIDAEWNAYVKRWRSSGGDAYLAELSKAPLVSELQKGKIVY